MGGAVGMLLRNEGVTPMPSWDEPDQLRAGVQELGTALANALEHEWRPMPGETFEQMVARREHVATLLGVWVRRRSVRGLPFSTARKGA